MKSSWFATICLDSFGTIVDGFGSSWSHMDLSRLTLIPLYGMALFGLSWHSSPCLGELKSPKFPCLVYWMYAVSLTFQTFVYVVLYNAAVLRGIPYVLNTWMQCRTTCTRPQHHSQPQHSVCEFMSYHISTYN